MPVTAAYDVPYMQRTRDYYRAQGYEKDYVWASFPDTPFAPLPKPLAACRVGTVTTAMPDDAEGRGGRRVRSAPSEPVPASMRTEDLSWHQSATHTDDVGSFLPLAALKALAAEGVVGGAAARFHSVPTDYSRRNTMERDAPEIFRRLAKDEVDVAVLVPL